MAKSKEQPVCTEIVCHSAVGGSVQIVKFEYTAKYNFSITRTYSIPDGWTEDDVDDFQQDKVIELRGKLEPIDEAEMAELLRQRDEAN
jgi:hypothetical protein